MSVTQPGGPTGTTPTLGPVAGMSEPVVDGSGGTRNTSGLSQPDARNEGAGGNVIVDVQKPHEALATRSQTPHGESSEPKKSEGTQMNTEARWDDLFKGTGEQAVATDQLDNKNDVKSRWQRAVKVAARLQAGDAIHPSEHDANAEAGPSRASRPQLDEKTKKARKARFWGKLTAPTGKPRDEGEELPFQSKALEQQHWLEMIDAKHRYGSNLKFYFREWKEADTKDNFFRWLDRGDGKDLDLEELPRERLEKEVITQVNLRYLSGEQRLNYLVKIDEDGLLRWVHNNELVDTAAGRWRDSGNGTGIVEDEAYIEAHADSKPVYSTAGANSTPRPARTDGEGDADDSASSVSSDSYGALSDLQENEATHYDEYNPENEGNWLERKVKAVTPAGMNKELLRKTLKGNTWIYASDMKMNMFIGIKQSGTFQHSSFTSGGKVTSAGILVVKRGRITKLNPHSGHYRSTIQHYKAFIAQLEDKGADLSHVKVGKSVLQMWGLGHYTAITKGQKTFFEDFKRKLHLKHELNEMEKSEALQKRVEEAEKKKQESGEGDGKAGKV